MSFWPYAAEHAVDILNRVMGPPGSKKSSYEIATGMVPKVMSIMPFGCRAYAIKPPVELAKTFIPSKAWRGMNLGRVPDVPGASKGLEWLRQRQGSRSAAQQFAEAASHDIDEIDAALCAVCHTSDVEKAAMFMVTASEAAWESQFTMFCVEAMSSLSKAGRESPV